MIYENCITRKLSFTSIIITSTRHIKFFMHLLAYDMIVLSLDRPSAEYSIRVLSTHKLKRSVVDSVDCAWCQGNQGDQRMI